MSLLAFYNPIMHLTSSTTISTTVSPSFAKTHPYAVEEAPVEVFKQYKHVADCHFIFAPKDQRDLIALEDLSIAR